MKKKYIIKYMLISNLKKTFFLLILFISLDAFAQSLNVLKLSCEYNPNLIKKKLKARILQIIKILIVQKFVSFLVALTQLR